MVLYELHYEFEPMWLVFVLMVVGTVCAPGVITKRCEEKNQRVNMTVVKIICGVFLAQELLMFSVTGTLAGIHRIKVSNAYHGGEYLIAEGLVENYSPYPLNGRNGVSFELDGVVFSCEGGVIGPGYHCTYAQGDLIREDGRHLKIGYLPGEDPEDHIIVYIEEIAEDLTYEKAA